MRICLVTNGLGFGGAERVVAALAEGAHAAGDAVQVLATTRDGPIGDQLRAQGIPVKVLGVGSAWDLGLAVRTRRAIAQFSPDVVHSHLAVSDIACALGVHGVSRLVTAHNPGVELGGSKRTLWGLALRRATAVTAVSEAVASTLPRRARVIHPSLVDLDHPPMTPEAAKRALGLDPGLRLVLGIGRLAPVKGFDVLAEVAPRLASKRTVVGVIGEGPERPRLGSLCLFGPRADASQLVAAADVFVAPSRSEGFPQAVLEAMAAGRPVVATAVGGTPELVVHGDTGLLVPTERAGQLEDAIRTLLEDPERADRMGRAGRVHLQTRSLDRRGMIERFRELYPALLSERGEAESAEPAG